MEVRGDLNLLKYMAFVETAECGSFTKAAEILNYSQSGISRMIHDLETEWNMTLLERDRSGALLTSDGLQLLPYTKQLCEEYRKLQMQVDDLKGIQTGMIRIGTFSSVATHWLPKIIKRFQADFPGIDYELLLGDYEEIEKWIGDGRVDCGFLRLPTEPEYETLFLEKDRLMAILPEGHSLAEYEKVPLSELSKEPFMLLQHGEKAEVAELFEAAHLRPRVRLTTWDDYSIMSMVEQGLGVSILPELILKRIPYKVVVKELDVPAAREIGLVVRSMRNRSLAVRKFME